MCGRFTLSSPAETVAAMFDLAETPRLTPRYNIAPTQPAPVVLMEAITSTRRFRTLLWGLIPSWAKDKSIGSRMINARAETVSSKPSFRSALRRRRCLIVADGFFEWKKLERRKQPFYVRMKDGRPFAFAGLWEHWEGADGEAIDSCTIITTEPSALMAPIHDRMPAILDVADHATWLDPELTQADGVLPLLRSYSGEDMVVHPVSTRVNSPSTDTPECTKPLSSGDS